MVCSGPVAWYLLFSCVPSLQRVHVSTEPWIASCSFSQLTLPEAPWTHSGRKQTGLGGLLLFLAGINYIYIQINVESSFGSEEPLLHVTSSALSSMRSL